MAAILTPFVTTWNFDACIYDVEMIGDIFSLLFLFVVLIAFVCPLVAIVYCTTRIFLVILRTHRQITAQVNSIGGENGSQATVPSLTFKAIRSGRNVLIVCLAFILLTIPFCVFAALSPFGLTKHWSSLYKFAAAWIVLSNSFINSFIYIVMFRSVRAKTADMLRGVFQRCTFR